MPALSIHYAGWCQIRLATNPDPTDEPRGVSGYTFALPGEPDLDRCIRFQNPVAPRAIGPDRETVDVGVRVHEVRLGGEVQPEHVLLGGDVELLNEAGDSPERPRDERGPRFEARDYILADPGHEALWPYHVRVAGGGVSLDRRASFGPQYDDLPIHRVPHAQMRRFGCEMMAHWAEVSAATGISDPKQFRRDRLAAVEALYARTPPEAELERAALELRLRELRLSPNADAENGVEGSHPRTAALTVIQTRNFPLTGAATVDDPDGRLGAVDPEAEWPTTFWFGGWDADALCSYVKGVLVVPLAGPS